MKPVSDRYVFRNCVCRHVYPDNGVCRLELLYVCRSATAKDLCTGWRQIVDACAFARPDTKPSGRSKGTREAFPRTLFTLSPDKNAIESNIKRSLFLADKSAFNYYRDLSEKGYYNRIISGNISQTIRIDSVSCNFDVYPYAVATYARQMIIRESSVTERSLVTRCRLLNAVRSDNNPHGFIMESFEITENKDLNTIKR